MTSATGIEISRDGASLAVELPLTFRKRGGRKQVISPAGVPDWSPPRRQVQSTLVKAVARAHRWRALLENGSYSSAAELAAAERINPSYVARLLRLTLLAPDIVEAILDGHSTVLTLDRLMKPFPVNWDEQRLSLQRLRTVANVKARSLAKAEHVDFLIDAGRPIQNVLRAKSAG